MYEIGALVRQLTLTRPGLLALLTLSTGVLKACDPNSSKVSSALVSVGNVGKFLRDIVPISTESLCRNLFNFHSSLDTKDSLVSPPEAICLDC